MSIEIEYPYFLLQNGWEHQKSDYLAEAVSFAETFMQPRVSQFYDRLAAEQDRTFYWHAAAILKSTLNLFARIR